MIILLCQRYITVGPPILAVDTASIVSNVHLYSPLVERVVIVEGIHLAVVSSSVKLFVPFIEKVTAGPIVCHYGQNTYQYGAILTDVNTTRSALSEVIAALEKENWRVNLVERVMGNRYRLTIECSGPDDPGRR